MSDFQNVSSTVEMRQWSNKAVIMRSERFIQLSPLDSENITIKEIDSSRKIVYEMQIECAEFYYGPQCARFCQPNIANVHFYCSPSGERLCMKGWTGRNCDDPICGKGCGNGFCVAPDTCRKPSKNRRFQVDPCTQIDCGRFGKCLLVNREEHRVECDCDAEHYGTRCEHKVNENDIVEKRVVHRPTMSSCKLSENDYIPNGFSWTTIDCRQCICSKGLISCTETRCEPRDCLRNDPSTGAAVTCPEHQGTAVEDVCHHLLLDITTGNMHNIGFDCSRRDETSVAVEIISLMFTSDVTIAKDFLKSRIRDRLTASAVLNAALRVGDYDANEQIVWERRTLKGATSKLFF
uniref:Delta-like protein n=1 Tax=Parascaris equorum TaxID=6256 RepID=A0A914S5I4_PAREQ